MKIHKILYIFSLALSVIIINSCNDLPTDMGSPLLFDTVGAVTVSSDVTPSMIGNTKNFLRKKARLNQNALYIGVYDDMKSGGVMIFSSDDFEDSLRSKFLSNIESVQLKLYPYDYIIGDTASKYISFDIYRVNDDKTEDWTWTKALQYDDAVSPANNYYDPANKVGSFSGSIPLDPNDSMYIDIDKNLLIDWLTNHYPAKTLENPIEFGLMIVPNENSKCVRRFRSPTLNTGGDTIYYNQLVVKYIDTTIADTALTYNFHSSSEGPFSRIDPPVNTNEIFIQSGIDYITQIDFDVSNIPSDASIVMAELELTINNEKSRIGSKLYDTTARSYDTTTALQCYSINEKYLNYAPEDIPLDSLSSTNQYYKRISGYYSPYYKKFFFRDVLILAVEDWVVKQKTGHLWFFMADTYSKMDKLVFYPITDPDPLKRPKFKVLYTRKPKLSK